MFCKCPRVKIKTVTPCEKEPDMDSHSQQPGHQSAKLIKQEAVDQIQEVVQERGDGEDQGELLVLTPTAWKHKQTEKLSYCEHGCKFWGPSN